MRKAQGDIISAVLIVIMSLGLISVVYTWGVPLIQKRTDTALVERTFKTFDRNNDRSITKIIEFISRHGGEDVVSLDTNGLWFVYPHDYMGPENNSIQFSFSAKVSNVAVDTRQWIPLSPGSMNMGTLGLDDPSVVFGKADSTSTGYNITYKIWFRELNETLTRKIYKINLVSAGPSISSGKTVKISRESVREKTIDNKNLIITEIKILLG